MNLSILWNAHKGLLVDNERNIDIKQSTYPKAMQPSTDDDEERHSLSSKRQRSSIQMTSDPDDDYSLSRVQGSNKRKRVSDTSSASEKRVLSSSKKKTLKAGFTPGPFDVICARGSNARNHTGMKTALIIECKASKRWSFGSW